MRSRIGSVIKICAGSFFICLEKRGIGRLVKVVITHIIYLLYLEKDNLIGAKAKRERETERVCVRES